MLKVSDLQTGYGNKQIINGISLEVNKGEIVAVIGHNGAGKCADAAAAIVDDGRAIFGTGATKFTRHV